MSDDNLIDRDTGHDGERRRHVVTAEQHGWLVVVLVAFFGVAFGGPALTRLAIRRREAQRGLARHARTARRRAHEIRKTTRRKLRRLAGGPIWR